MSFSRVSFSASLSAECLGIVTTVYMGIKQLDDTPGLYTRANFLKLFSIMRGRRSRFSGPGGKRWLWGAMLCNRAEAPELSQIRSATKSEPF
jgi:hypothetical protein